ncbi:MAG: hypothetical protein Rubg2KO_21130 [Rubricoccaceae bacterium]
MSDCPQPETRQRDVLRHPAGSTFAERRDALVQYYADRQPDGDKRPALGYIELAARLEAGRPLDTVLPLLDELLSDPTGDMFWMVPMAFVHHVGRDRLPADVLARMRDLWRTYTPYRGDTENHWLKYYASLYLMAQLDPDSGPETWFNGRSAEENLREAESTIESWIELTVAQGQGEFDSPHYLPFFLAPLALIHGWAEDPAMRQRAAMMMDLLIAGFAVNSLDGLYAGAMSRIYPEPTLERWRNGSTTFAWLLFGNTPLRPDGINNVLPRPGYRPHGMALVLALSGYEPPEVIRQIATDRRQPAVHRQRARTRHRIRYSDVRNAPVLKTISTREEYAVGSCQGGLLQPIQQHTWEVLWATEDPHEGFNTLFSVHPYAGPLELGMYFAEHPEHLMHVVVRHEKNTYDKPDKWTGGSPFEHVTQIGDAVVALYDIPPETQFEHVSTYLSRTLRQLEERDSGWIVARGGDALIALRPLTPVEWRDEPGGDRRLHHPQLKTGLITQVAPASTFSSLDAFATAVEALELTTDIEPTPSVRFTTLDGRQLEVTYGALASIDGVPIDASAWPLWEGPNIQSDGHRVTLRHGEQTRVLDFDARTIEDQP